MRTITTLLICIILCSCKFFKKSPEDVYIEKMKTATEAELMNEIIGKPLTYELITYDYTSYFARNQHENKNHYFNASNVYFAQRGGYIAPDKMEGDALGLEKHSIKAGAILQVIFTEGSVYIEKFGRLNGDYKSGIYASSDGSLKLKFGDRPSGPISNADFIGAGNINSIRNNPVRQCARFGIIHSYILDDINIKRPVNVHYYLKSLTQPGYFHKEDYQQ